MATAGLPEPLWLFDSRTANFYKTNCGCFNLESTGRCRGGAPASARRRTPANSATVHIRGDRLSALSRVVRLSITLRPCGLHFTAAPVFGRIGWAAYRQAARVRVAGHRRRHRPRRFERLVEGGRTGTARRPSPDARGTVAAANPGPRTGAVGRSTRWPPTGCSGPRWPRVAAHAVPAADPHQAGRLGQEPAGDPQRRAGQRAVPGWHLGG